MKEKIKKLAKKRKAIILAHNYQPPEIQEISDLCGDSLELSIKASQTDAEVILFCGVTFMAETASILSPDKTVLLPRKDAGCPMADMIEAKDLGALIEKHPGVPVVTYVNSTAAVKALTTICCTSSNVVEVVESLDSEEIIMVPDKNLAMYAASKVDKKINVWNGYCPIHDKLTAADVIKVKLKYKDALFMAHPECKPEVLDIADVVLSTSGMINFAKKSEKKTFIVGTEIGLLYPLKKANPDKDFYPASSDMECEDMKKISYEDIYISLEHMKGEIKVTENIRRPALKAVKKMIDLSLKKK